MRCAWPFILIALLISPVRVWSQVVARPVSSDGRCSVPAEEHWKPQEKFVWFRVCVGEVADFNKEPGYGGEVDPKRPAGLPESRILSSTFLETILLRDNYRNALTRHGVRIVGARFTEIIDLEDAELGHDLWLDKSLLEKGANFFGARTMHRITIDGSKVTGPLNMMRLEVAGDLTMHNGTELTEVHLELAHIGGQLDLSSSKIADTLDMDFAHINQEFNLSSSKMAGALSMQGIQIGYLVMSHAEFAKVNLTAAHVQGVLSLYNSRVTGNLKMAGLQVDGLLEANEADFAGVDLEFAHVGGRFNLTRSKVHGLLNMQGIQIAGHLVMSVLTQFTNVDLTAAHVQGMLSLHHSKVTGELKMEGLQVDGLLEANDSEFAYVDLESAHVSGRLNLAGSKFGGGLDMEGIQIAGQLVMNRGAKFAWVNLTAAHVQGAFSLHHSVTRELKMDGLYVDDLLEANDSEFFYVDLESAHVGGRLNLNDSKVASKFNAESLVTGGDVLARRATFADVVGFRSARIDGSLDLSGSVAYRIDLTGAFVRNDLRLGGEGLRLQWRWGAGSQAAAPWTLGNPGWQTAPCGARLILRNTQVSALQDTADAWPPDLDLEGFKYDHLGGFSDESTADIRNRVSEYWGDWLLRDRKFSTQPYMQLARVLQTAGHRDAAEEVLHYSRTRERREEKHWGRWMWLTVLGGIAGYGIGVYTFNALYWVTVLTLLGALILHWFAPNARRRGVIWCLGARACRQ